MQRASEWMDVAEEVRVRVAEAVLVEVEDEAQGLSTAGRCGSDRSRNLTAVR